MIETQLCPATEDAKIGVIASRIRKMLIFLTNNCWRFAQETFESMRCAGLITSRRARSNVNF